MFQRDLHLCKEVTLEDWKHRGSSTKIAEAFSGLFRPFY
jgi:hypothetical protein